MKKSHIIILILLAFTIGLFASKLGNVDSYANFEDAKSKEGTKVQLTGMLVKEKPIVYDPQKDPNSFSFYLTDETGKQFQVICNDDLPRDLEKVDKIVLTGEMRGETFYASDILVKCPSKYQETEVEK